KDMVWTIGYWFGDRQVVFEETASAIDAYQDTYSGSKFVIAIVENEIRKYGVAGNTQTPLAGDFVTIQEDSDDYEWADVVIDKESLYLYASDLKTNQVYRFDLSMPESSKTSVAGNSDGVAANDETHLDRPQGVKFYNNELYILQGSGEDARVVRWPVGQSSRRMVYEFVPQGRLGFEVSEVTEDFIYYREGDGSVYKHCLNEPCNSPLLIAGGCGMGHASNQLTNGGSGAIRMDHSGDLIIWDFGGQRFVRWDNKFLECPVCPSTTSSLSPHTTTRSTTTRISTTTMT
ncbi:hypothetical protein FOL47_004330, partial [Perkinsus chesapeaki]